jgi:hypothetical protein
MKTKDVRFESRLKSLLNDRVSAITGEAFRWHAEKTVTTWGKVVDVKLTVV